MEKVELKTDRREVTGKRVRFLRREGITPLNLYGPNIESLSLQADTATLNRLLAKVGRNALVSLKIDGDKKPKMAMVRDIQRDPLNDRLIHIDFFQVEMTHSIKVDVPILFVGEAPAAKSSRAMLIHNIAELHVEALPADIPHNIEVDLSNLEEIGQSIHVADISVPDGVTVLTEDEQVVAKIEEARVAVVEEELVAEEVEEEEVEEEAEAEEAAAEEEAKEESE